MLSGLAHINPEPFNGQPPRGWGRSSWRHGREFVGRISHGVRYILWQPESLIHSYFPASFQDCALTLLCCNTYPGSESSFGILTTDVVMYILNMCSWHWFSSEGVRPEIKEVEPINTFNWTQDEDDIEILIKVAPTTKTKHIRIEFGRHTLAVFVSSEEEKDKELEIINSELTYPIDVDDSTWTLQGSGPERELCITLCKHSSTTWRSLLQVT